MPSQVTGSDRRIGITTTVPLEILFAAGLEPVDLNNRFINSSCPADLVTNAERSGFPRNICTWIKGIYSAVKKEGISMVVGVVQGDCSNTHALLEILRSEGIKTHEFAYPYSRDAAALQMEMERFLRVFQCTWADALRVKERMGKVRAMLEEVDSLTWKERRVTGEENFTWCINSSDMLGNIEVFEKKIGAFLDQARRRSSRTIGIPIGLIGIPPIVSLLFPFLEERGTAVVFNEMARQFSMPEYREDLVGQYRAYTYPYDVFRRVEDIRKEVERRGLRALIHYVQSFCFRQIQDRILREQIPVPLLTLECNRPGPLDEQSRTRVEAFLEMVSTMN